MKALKIAGIVVGIVVLGVAVLIVSAPSSNHVESSIIINASSASIYKEAVSFKNYTTWSPWAKMDPQAKYSYDGPEAGIGSKVTWEGSEIGKGYQEIIAVVENTSIKNKMAFEGVPGTYISEMKLEPVDGGTKVTWTYDSDYTNTSGMTGSFGQVKEFFLRGILEEQYSIGLKELKRVVESNPEDPR